MNVYFIINLLASLGALVKPFQLELKENVERYKYNNFRWNVLNLNTDTFISLRDLEERKDKEFSEYLVQEKNFLNLQNTEDRMLVHKTYITSTKSLRHMTYNDQSGTLESHTITYFNPGEPLSVMYKARQKGSPQVMMYINKEKKGNVPHTLIYNARDKRSPLVMMYKNKEKKGNVPHTLIYNARDKRSPLVMMYKNKEKKGNGPHTLIYNARDKRSPLVMMYKNKEKKGNGPHTLIYNARDKRSPLVMMYKNKEKKGNGPHTLIYNARDKRSPQVMRYKSGPQSMMYNSRDKRSPQVMVYNSPNGPMTMMYNERHIRSPQVMVRPEHSPQVMVRPEHSPQIMVYNSPNGPMTMMYSERHIRSPQVMRYKNGPQSMMYNSQQKRSPQIMMYNDPIGMQTMMYNARDKRSPQVMMYNDPIGMQTMMYNARDKRSPQVMMYNDPIGMQTMMYNARDKRSPQVMMYNDPIGMQTMMYNARDKRSPQVMMYNDPIGLQTMMYNARDKRSPQVMMYMQTMMYNARDKHSPQVMMYNDPIGLQKEMYNAQPERSSEVLMYNSDTDVDFKSLDSNISLSLFSNLQFFGADRNASVDILSKSIDIDQTTEWITFAKSLVKPVPKTADEFFRRWKHTISVFNGRELSQQLFISKFPVLRIEAIIQKIATSNVFEKLFWPFLFENAFMNQKLGLLGLSGLSVPPEEQKSTFHEVLEKYQTIRIPFARDRILLSFDDSDLIDGLNRSGLMETSKQYVNAGLHLYTQDEQTFIRHKVDAAMTMINRSMPELYKAIHQVIGCIAFYKAQRAGFAGGTVSSALGVIWEDPRAYKEHSVAHYAEQIVHEYIHSSLFLADLVHGTFADYNLLSRAKAYSPIRHQLRDFDKVFHASYVSTGVAVFHARAGNWDKVHELLEPLGVSVNDLDAINTEFGLLNDSGNAMLQAMKDFLTLIGLI